MGFFGLYSPGGPGHCRRLFFHGSVHHASTFLRPLAPRPLGRFVATTDALTPVPRFFGAEWLRTHERRSLLMGQVSLLHVPALPTIPTPTTLTAPASLYGRRSSPITLPFSSPGFPPAQHCWLAGLGFAISLQARHRFRPNRVHLRFGLVVHLQLLSTWPRGHAVTFSYGPENVCPERTRTSRC